jgi:hypothetical protein
MTAKIDKQNSLRYVGGGMAIRRVSIFLALAGIILLILFFFLRAKDDMADFGVNYQAGQRLRNGETLYRTADGHWQFKYFPFSAFLYLPLTLLPFVTAKAVWFAIVALASVMIFVISSKLIDHKANTFFSPAVLAGLVLARYFLRELQLGQINAPITLLMVLAIWFLSESSRRPTGALGGPLVGLGTALKPYALAFFPYLALRKRWTGLASSLAVLGLCILAPALFYGWKGNLVVLAEWRSSLTASTPSLLSSQDNVSLLAFLLKRTHDLGLSLIIYGVVVAVLCVLVAFLVLRGNRLSGPRTALEGFLLLALIPLISPLGWDYTFLSTAPALLLIFRHADKYRPFWKGFLIFNSLVICLSLYDLMGRRLYAAFMSSSVITLHFLALVGYLAYLRIKGHA